MPSQKGKSSVSLIQQNAPVHSTRFSLIQQNAPVLSRRCSLVRQLLILFLNYGRKLLSSSIFHCKEIIQLRQLYFVQLKRLAFQ